MNQTRTAHESGPACFEFVKCQMKVKIQIKVLKLRQCPTINYESGLQRIETNMSVYISFIKPLEWVYEINQRTCE